MAGVLSFRQGDVIIHSSSKQDAIYCGSHFKALPEGLGRLLYETGKPEGGYASGKMLLSNEESEMQGADGLLRSNK
jgi:hypothetical protein